MANRVLKIFVIFMIFLSAVSCVKKPTFIDSMLSAKDVINKAYETTPMLCAYKGRVSISAVEQGESVSFSALLNKKCNGDFSLIVLGAFNKPIADISLNSGELSVNAPDEETKMQILSASGKYAETVSKYLNSPLFDLKGYTSFSITDTEYIFRYVMDGKAYVGSDFLLSKYVVGSVLYNYLWKDDKISQVDISGYNYSITIKFLNSEAWSSK